MLKRLRVLERKMGLVLTLVRPPLPPFDGPRDAHALFARALARRSSRPPCGASSTSSHTPTSRRAHRTTPPRPPRDENEKHPLEVGHRALHVFLKPLLDVPLRYMYPPYVFFPPAPLHFSPPLYASRNPAIFPPSPPTALTFHTTSFPSIPLVLTRRTAPRAPSNARTLVIVFWCTVNSSVSAPAPAPPLAPPPAPCPIPRESALRNVLNAALFSRPTGAARPPPAPPPADLGAVVSSSEPTARQPALALPEKSTGWQSCPAATSASSAVQASVTYGRELILMVKTAGPPG